MELVDEVGVQFQGVELNGIRHTEEVRESNEEKEIALLEVFPIDQPAIRSDVQTLIDLSGGAQTGAPLVEPSFPSVGLVHESALPANPKVTFAPDGIYPMPVVWCQRRASANIPSTSAAVPLTPSATAPPLTRNNSPKSSPPGSAATPTAAW